MKLYAIAHQSFRFVTNDTDVVIARLLAGYSVRAIDHLSQSPAEGRAVSLIDYGNGHYLPRIAPRAAK